MADYHQFRPHQGNGNVLLPRRNAEQVEAAGHADESATPPLVLADIKCDKRLGRLPKHFYRNAALPDCVRASAIVYQPPALSVRAVAVTAIKSTGFNRSAGCQGS